jgi:hypothetical protein
MADENSEGDGTPEAAPSGEILAGRSEDAEAAPAAAGSGDDPGGPGGMGGVHGGVSNPDHRPNGGVSPLQNPNAGGAG